MSATYFTCLSGMLAASYGLQNTSNNVANLQTPGFKRNEVFYSSLGSGVCAKDCYTNFNDGTYQASGNASDLAIVGQGFFVIRLKSNEFRYTRDGAFIFDTHGFLIDRNSGGQVQGYDGSGNLVPIREKGPQYCQGKASQEVFLQGKFVPRENNNNDIDPTGETKNKYQNISFNVAKIFDAQGKEHTLSLEFQSTPKDPIPGNPTDIEDGCSWYLSSIRCDDAELEYDTEQVLIFSENESGAKPENSLIKLKLNGIQGITLNFGTFRDGADKSVQIGEYRDYMQGTDISIYQNDGYGIGKQISYSFDDNGQISYNYDNGQSVQGVYVGLARFDDIQHCLIANQDTLFIAKDDANPHFGRANSDGFGSIKSQNLEKSNVDSTAEFANIIILQRMFQACSQLMDIDKQLLEDLETKS